MHIYIPHHSGSKQQTYEMLAQVDEMKTQEIYNSQCCQFNNVSCEIITIIILNYIWYKSDNVASNHEARKFTLHCMQCRPSSPGIDNSTVYTLGPKPHFLGYVSRSMITRLILATIPWSHPAIVAVVISAMAEIHRHVLDFKKKLSCMTVLLTSAH
jgi:hypothetical protein